MPDNDTEPKLEVCLNCHGDFGVSQVGRCVICKDYPVCEKCRRCGECQKATEAKR